MTGATHLVLHHDLLDTKQKCLVHVSRDEPLAGTKSQFPHLRSVSPIFPIADTPFIPSKDQSFRIVFLVHRQPFIQVGKLGSAARKYLWYSLGITGLLAIFPHDVDEAAVLAPFEHSEILCKEAWHVQGGFLEDPVVEFPAIALNDLAVTVDTKVPEAVDMKRIARELSLNLDALQRRAALLMPSLLPTLNRVMVSVNSEIEALIRNEGFLRKGACGGSDSEECAQSEAEDYLATHKQLNLSVDALMQLNSALAYILSQSFYGGPPLLKNLSLNSCHSLLGIGTAIKALQRLTEFIINGFSRFPIALVARANFRQITLRHYLRSGTDPMKRGTPDDFIEDNNPTPQTPKLAYFSTRMGFSEHGYCVTAATQCLAAADVSRRSLLTLTHELLHSHVKGLLATILAINIEHGQQDLGLLSLIQEYKRHAHEAEENSSVALEWTVSEFLRFRILAFCDGMHKVVSENPGCAAMDGGPLALNSGPDTNDFSEIERFKNSYSFLNELIVHTLDFHYFYDESPDLFLTTLWKSWATVPGVADKIEWYILRCLAAVSVVNMAGLSPESFPSLKDVLHSTAGGLDSRFNEAINLLEVSLGRLSAEETTGAMPKVVLSKLKSSQTKLWLRQAFFPCHLFAQVVKQFLYSPRLRTFFDSYADPLADRDDDGKPVYRLQSLEFHAGPIRNPVALLRNRLSREASEPEVADEEARSAWLFLALASVPPTE